MLLVREALIAHALRRHAPRSERSQVVERSPWVGPATALDIVAGRSRDHLLPEGSGAVRRHTGRMEPVGSPLKLPDLAGRLCRLRPWIAADAASVAEAAQDPEIFDEIPPPTDPAEFIERQHRFATDGKAMSYAIVPADGDQAIGLVELAGLGQSPFVAELSFWVLSDYRRRGFATDASTALLRWAFTSRPTLLFVWIHRKPDKEATAEIAKRLHATELGTITTDINDKAVELIRHQLHRDDWVDTPFGVTVAF